MTLNAIDELADRLATEHAGEARFSIRLLPDLLDDVASALAGKGFLVARDSERKMLTVRNRSVSYQWAPGGCA